MTPLSKREIPFAVLLCLTLITVELFVFPYRGITNDGRAYLAVSESPFSSDAPAPYSNRLLAPLIVHFLPFQHETGFRVVSSVSLFLLLALGYIFLRRCRVSPTASGIVIALFALSDVVLYNLQHPILVDPLSYLLILAAFLTIKEDRLFAASVILTFAVLAKESALFVLPMFYFLDRGREKLFDHESLKKTVLCSILPLTAYIAIYHTSAESLPFNWVNISLTRGAAPRLLFGTFGLLWLSSIGGISKAERASMRMLFFIIFALVPIPFVTDTWRMLYLLFPVVLLFSGIYFDHIPGKEKYILIPIFTAGFIITNTEIASNLLHIVLPGNSIAYAGTVIGILLVPAPFLKEKWYIPALLSAVVIVGFIALELFLTSEFNRGVEALKGGKPYIAGKRFERVVAFHPDFIPAIVNLAVVRINEGEIDDAERLFRQALSHSPNEPVLSFYLGSLLYQKGERQEAIRYLEKASSIPEAKRLCNEIKSNLTP